MLGPLYVSTNGPKQGAAGWFQRTAITLEKAIYRKGRQGRTGKQGATPVIKITILVITSEFTWF
jgi:hypothetical protein